MFSQWVIIKNKTERSFDLDDEEGTPPPVSIEENENMMIHLHKEEGTGGHWCAKILFFAVLAALTGAICLIIIEHQGESDGESINL